MTRGNSRIKGQGRGSPLRYGVNLDFLSCPPLGVTMLDHIVYIIVGFGVGFLAFMMGRLSKFIYYSMHSNDNETIKWED